MLLTNTGAFWGAFLGCYVVSSGGWTWSFKASAILNGTTLLLMIFCMPETLYPRKQGPQEHHGKFDWFDRFVRLRKRRTGQINPLTALRPLRMAIYPSVFFPSFLTAISNTFICVGISLIVPSFFADVYGFSLKGAGNVNLAFIIGALLGEVFAGRWSDALMSRLARSKGGIRTPELRLRVLWPALILMPVC
jgi:predicted MFS family arabinose efflux permease